MTTCVVRTRDLRDIGLTPDVVRGLAWRAPWHGVYVRANDDAPLLDHRALSAVLPRGSGFGHLTGALLREWWVPWVPRDLVLLATTTGTLHVRRPGTYVRRSPRTRIVDGTPAPLVHPAETLAELAGDLGLVDLVVTLDSALRSGGCTAADVLAVTARGGRGCRRLRQAVSLADARSESPWESVLRLVHVLSGVAEVEVQPDLYDAQGRHLARADLLIRGTRRLPEYDGGVHRDHDQHLRDLARDKRLSRNRWERYGYTAREIELGADRIIADAEDALELAPAQKRRDRWRQFARESTISRAGRAQLAARLARYRDAPRTPRRR